MIGIFDSGSGGLTFLAAMRQRFPEGGYLYFADYEHCPYGDRAPDEIRFYTSVGVKKLFDAGATIVILACNTASAWSLRYLQSEIYPEKKILGVTIPGAERVVENGLKKIVVFATEQTVKSRTYSERMHLLDQHIQVEEIPFSGELVKSIESLLPIQQCQSEKDFFLLASHYSGTGWDFGGDEWENLIHTFFASEKLHNSISSSDGVVLGCTHYSYLRNLLQVRFPSIPFIDPSEEAADKLLLYFSRNPDIFRKIWKTSSVKFI